MRKEAAMKGVGELSRRVSVFLREEAEKLYDSGGINPGDYEEEGFALPKVLIFAALQSATENYRPFDMKHRRDAANLRHF